VVQESITLHGDLLDEKLLSAALNILNAHGVSFETKKFRIGEWSREPSLVEIVISAEDEKVLRTVLEALTPLGAAFSRSDAMLRPADQDGVWPEDFHSTTNFPTQVIIDGNRVPVERLEMDCAIRVWKADNHWRAETCPMHRVRKGDLFVVGYEGVRVLANTSAASDEDDFRFMSNEVSSERPKSRMIADAAGHIRQARAEGRKVLLVGGPAIIHSGCGPVLAGLIRDGWINVLFAGNALAAHDIESEMLGTSLGVDLSTGTSRSHGHTHHLRAINRVRRSGSITNAVRDGLIQSGAMHACVTTGTPFVLCGSIRDDGPLPDVYTDVVQGVDAMRQHVPDVSVCLMVATTLHSVATGNILPASVRTYCVDSDADTVIKLTDRGTHQAVGIVTDCEFFMRELARQLADTA
jgi:lysine-ketoglutarate reductase/saccharopine dehydrogenase-like protein (TIGR00300 family)